VTLQAHLEEASVLHALAVLAAAVSTVAMLIVLFLTVFVVSLAFRARRMPDPRKHTTNP
jgi:hypothetical protein